MKPSEAFMLEGAGWPAFLLDEEATVLRANASAVKAFGPVIESPGSQFSAIWGGEGAQPVSAYLAHWSQTPSPSVTLKLKWKAGGVAAHTVSICSFRRDEQRLFLLQMLGETANAEAVAAQKQKLDCALQLARTVSLDFNNALTSILGHASLILSKADPDNPWHASLIEIEKSAAKAAEISNDLATFSRQEKEPKKQASGNLNELIQQCVESFQRKARTVEVKWVLHSERRLFMAKFDEAKLLQALMKVVENSVEALPDAGQITLQTRNVELKEAAIDRGVQLLPGNYVCLEIVDTGKGIEPEVLPRVFEPFFTTKRNHRGLGLAWVYGIVTNHGGGVAISSQPNTGTSVRLYLPAEQQVVHDISAGGSRELSGTQTVLLVDDEDLLLTMGQAVLSNYGYKVITANSGQKAVEILHKNEPQIDLLVTDLVMPVMSGRELVEQARKLSPEIRVICTSGYAWPGDRRDPFYLQKPFTSQELLLKVKQALA